MNLPQQSSPAQLAWCRCSNSYGAFIGVVVLPNEKPCAAVRIKDSHGFVSTSQLENNSVLFVTRQALSKPIYVELLDHENRSLSQRLV